MNRINCLCAVVFSLLVVSVAGAQSLGEVARQQRQAKRPSAAKVYTNDEIPMVAAPEPAAVADSADKKVEESDKKEATGEASPAAEDKGKGAAALQAKAEAMKKEIAQLEREYTVSEREYKLRAATYYADAGNSLRDPKKWAEQDRQYQAEMADKRKAIDAAKEKLAELQEQARKENVKMQ